MTLEELVWATLVVGLLSYLATIPLVIHRSHHGDDVMPSPAPIFSKDPRD